VPWSHTTNDDNIAIALFIWREQGIAHSGPLFLRPDSNCYGHEVKGELVFRAVGEVVGLLKSAALTFVSVQVEVRTTERAFEFEMETEGD